MTTANPSAPPRKRAVLAFLAFLILTLVGVGVATAALYERRVLTRGWSDPATDAALPFRGALPGVNVDLTQYAPEALPAELARIAQAGFVWVRQTFDWALIEPSEGVFDFSAYAPIMDALREIPTLRLVAVLDSTPAWARRPEASDRLYAPPASMAAFATFAAELARRYGDQIDHYQVWDEPNLNTHWGGLDPRPADYAAMLKAVYAAIHAADGTATVIAAGLAPTMETGPRNLSDVVYLEALYAAGAADAFDAAAGKPYGFDHSPDDRTVDANRLNFSRLILLREVMVKHGDGRKPLWGSHFGWNSLPPDWTGRPSIWGAVDSLAQESYTRRAYERAANEWAWAGGLILAYWQPAAPADDPIQGFAVREKARAWFADGAFFDTAGALPPGLYPPDDPRLAYSGRWRFGALGADLQIAPDESPPADGSGHTIRFRFRGGSLGFLVRRGDFTAYLYPRVDGQPGNTLPRIPEGNPVGGGEAYILLKSPTRDPLTEMIQAARLPHGDHEAAVGAWLGYDQWILAGVGVGSPPPSEDGRLTLGVLVALIGGIGAAFSTWRARRILRAAAEPVLHYSGRMGGVLGGIGVSLAAAVGMALTLNNALPELLRRDIPALFLTGIVVGGLSFSPILPLTGVALIALWVLIYNRPLIGLALIVFWMPFFLAPIDLHVYALPMVELATLITASVVAVRAFFGWMLRSAADPFRRYAPPAHQRTPLRWAFMDTALIAFVILGALSLTWSAQINPASRELRIMILQPILFYALLRLYRPTVEDAVRLVDVLILAGGAVALYGMIGYLTGGWGITLAEGGSRRLMSVYTSPNNLALFLGRVLPFAVAFVLIAPGRPRKIAAAMLSALIGAALLLTQSVGALLIGVPAALIVVLLLWDRRRGLLAAGAILIAVGGIIALARFVPRLQGAFDVSRSSSFIRVQLWTSTLNLLSERPLTGAGLDQFLYLYRSRYILPEAWQEPDLSHPHNILLDFWVRLGIGGVALLIALQAAFWQAAWRAYRAARAKAHLPQGDPRLLAVIVGGMGVMTDVLAHGLVDHSYFVTDLAYVFCFLLALVTIFGGAGYTSEMAAKREDQHEWEGAASS